MGPQYRDEPTQTEPSEQVFQDIKRASAAVARPLQGGNVAKEKAAIQEAINNLDSDLGLLSDQLFSLDDKLFPVSSQIPTESYAKEEPVYQGSSDLYNYILKLNDVVTNLQSRVRTTYQRIEL